MLKRSVAAAFSVVCLVPPAFSADSPALEQGEVLSTEGRVDWTRPAGNWTPAVVGQKLHVQEQLRTLALSRAMLQLAELGRLRLDELTTLEILPPRETSSKGTIDLKAGAMYFFTRDRPREFLIQTPRALAASRGTEFLVKVDPKDGDIFTVFDGEVQLSNSLGSVTLTNGEQGISAAGQPPRKTAALEMRNVVQWWVYYPAVADPDEFGLNPAEQAELAGSLAAYRQGDLLAALQNYPAGRSPQSGAERLYYAAILLAVGRADAADAQLALADTNSQVATGLREAVAVVLLRLMTNAPAPRSATEWIAKSYLDQSQFDLRSALASARAAVEKSPLFGFGWERVAELEFSFGHTREAAQALETAIQLCPRNAQAWALRGFLQAARGDLDAARGDFQTAITLDAALGNGWLGRGLVRIRRGDRDGGRADLQTAAAMEPNRSLLRSYLGKAFEHAGDARNAEKELRLAQQLDKADPTPWLYSALVLRQQLRFNDAVDDLEKSIAMNDNRAVYRSRLLLDEDRAVRSASLASIYQDTGMKEVSVREAVQSVASDYANYSAHQFLAESFDALRDPTRFNLRMETAWFNELLLANLLSPVGGNNLSQNISQQEYSRLFEGNQLGLSSTFEGRSDGQYREVASQYGTVDNFGYALDLDYQHNDGVRPNNELDRIEWYATAKYQISPQDSVMLLTKYYDYHSGDNFQYYDPSAVRTDLQAFGITNYPVIRTNFTFNEYQKPLAVVGYHREWSPGMHTLFLAGHLEDEQDFSDKNTSQLILTRGANGNVQAVNSAPFDVAYQSVFDAFTAELSQILQFEHHLFVVGARYQGGSFDTTNLMTLSPEASFLGSVFPNPPATGEVTAPFQRISGYGYYTWSPVDELHLTAGVAYDSLIYPTNYRQPPVSGGSSSTDQVSPKAALVWSPLPELAFRAAFTRSLGGVTFDESFRLEPTELAGFSQAFRSIISESIVGSVTAPTYDTAAGAMDLKFKTGTYIGIQGQALRSEVDQQVGVFNYSGALPPPPPVTTGSTPEQLTYNEYSALATVNQLVSHDWSFGAQYGFTRSKLHTLYPDIPVSISPSADLHQQADLHQVNLYALYSHPSGFFALAETQWYMQDNVGYTPAEPGDNFFMHNVFIGWRLKRQRGQVSIGLMNLAGTNYKLNPLNPYSEMPRERVVAGRFQVNF